jgi:hypothetical protein
VRRILGAILALLLALLAIGSQTSAATAAASRTQVRVSDRFFGIHDGSGLAYGRVGFGSIRLWDAQVTWSDIETSPGVYDWNRLDTLVRLAQEHRTQVTLVLAMTPAFYASARSLPPDDLGHYRDYVRAVMTRYRSFEGRRGIVDYQVWNEGNVPTFWTGTPHQLAELTRIVHRVRNHVDPAAKVVAPSFAVRLVGQRRWLSRYVSQRVTGRRVWRYYDVNALSLYPKATYGDRTGGPEDAIAMLGGVRHRLSRAHVPDSMPLWATEINYGLPTGAPPGHLAAEPISESRQSANVIRTYLLAAAAGISRVYWYRYDWNELPAASGGGTLGNTLLSDTVDHSVVTPAGKALTTVERWLRGRLVGTEGRRPCAHDARGTYTCTVRHHGTTRAILWNPLRKVRVRVPGRTATDAMGRPRTTMRTSKLEVGYHPVLVELRR